MRKYFTLIERQKDGTWSPEFGDYSRSVVNQERHDRHESWPFPKMADMRVVWTDDDSQASINKLLAEINEAELAKQNQKVAS